MKRIVLAFAFFGLLMLNATDTKAQALKQGDIALDVTYGFPNLYRSILKSAYINSGLQTDEEIGGIGPVGIRAEYFVSEHIAIGVEFNYTNTTLSFEEEGVDQNMQPTLYTYEISAPRIRIMPRFSFHYGEVDNFDFFSSVGIGYNRITYKLESNDPDFSDEELENLIPIAFRIATGARYYFTDNVGAMLELGLGGGGVVTGGLSVKL